MHHPSTGGLNIGTWKFYSSFRQIKFKILNSEPISACNCTCYLHMGYSALGPLLINLSHKLHAGFYLG